MTCFVVCVIDSLLLFTVWDIVKEDGRYNRHRGKQEHLEDLVGEAKRGVAILGEILGVLQELVRLHAKPLNYQPIVPDRPSFTRLAQEGETRRRKFDVNGQRYGRFGEPIGAVHGPETVMPAGVLDHAKV